MSEHRNYGLKSRHEPVYTPPEYKPPRVLIALSLAAGAALLALLMGTAGFAALVLCAWLEAYL